MLDENLRMYCNIMKQEELLKKQKEALKAQIISEMNEDTYQNSFAKATISVAQTFKYVNEPQMVAVLKNKGYDSLVKEKVDTKINQIFKDALNTELINALSGLYDKVDVEKLIVTEI